MTNYYWIIARHSQKVLEVEGGSFGSCANIIQHTKKSELDPFVDMQLWYFDGGFIVNKRSGFVIDVAGEIIENCTKIIQYPRKPEPSHNQEWEYNHEDNTIGLKSNRNFVLDVEESKTDNHAFIILYEKHGGENQQFILQKWNDCSVIENANNDRTLAHIELPNILPEIFEMILRYIYGGKLSLKECDSTDQTGWNKILN
ncbi:unnamed protein product [Rhizophagus irregularis]|nr:unnamed protein product [Rhizophagus irregularis]